MNTKSILLPFASLLTALTLGGCVYDVPLAERGETDLDRSLPGAWFHREDDGDQHQMVVLPLSKSECLVHYPADEDGIYYRGYAIEVGGVDCVQLEVLGTKDGPIPPDAGDRFLVVSWQRDGEALVVRTLNTDLVPKNLTDTKDLRAAFIKHKDKIDLFVEPIRFERPPDEDKGEG